MDNFEEYLRQGEPNKAEKAKVWKAAIGLQLVDDLKPSNYLIATAKQNIDGNITIEEVKKLIDAYYQKHPVKNDENRTEEADKVSTRIAEILSEKSFTFSTAEYLNIHRRLFCDIYSQAGKIRDYNITKKEWVLSGETVLYGSAESLKDTLEYDFEIEKKYNYKGLSQREAIEHIGQFISRLWQIHVFGEGNTRTTAIFLIKYLNTFGYVVNNELFEKHSWYFRNALVRGNYTNHAKNIYATYDFLFHFLENLMLGKNHLLKNREMHVHYLSYEIQSSEKTKKSSEKTKKSSEKIIELIKLNAQITTKELAEQLQITNRAIEKNILKLKTDGKLQRIGADKGGYWKLLAQGAPLRI